MAFFWARVRMQCGLLAAYFAQILTIFATTDVNQFVGSDWHEKIPNFCAGSLVGPQNAICWGFLGAVLVPSLQLKHYSFG